MGISSRFLSVCAAFTLFANVPLAYSEDFNLDVAPLSEDYLQVVVNNNLSSTAIGVSYRYLTATALPRATAINLFGYQCDGQVICDYGVGGSAAVLCDDDGLLCSAFCKAFYKVDGVTHELKARTGACTWKKVLKSIEDQQLDKD